MKRIKSSPAIQSILASMVVGLVAVIFFLVDNAIGTGIVLTLTAMGAIAYAVLVHHEVRQGTEALEDQKKANELQALHAEKQLMSIRLQITQQQDQMHDEANRWRRSERRAVTARLDGTMPVLEISPTELGVGLAPQDEGSERPITPGSRFSVADETFLRWRVAFEVCIYGNAPVNVFFPSVFGGDYYNISRDEEFWAKAPSPNQLVRPGERFQIRWRQDAKPRLWIDYLQNGYPDPDRTNTDERSGALVFPFAVSDLAQSITDSYEVRLFPTNIRLSESQLEVIAKNQSSWPTAATHVKRDYRFDGQLDAQ